MELVLLVKLIPVAKGFVQNHRNYGEERHLPGNDVRYYRNHNKALARLNSNLNNI